MKILVISDTHGKIGEAKKIWESIDDLDLVLHLGDHFGDGKKLSASIQTDVLGVTGNCDRKAEPLLHRVVDTEFGPILMTHGHVEKVRRSLDNLIYRAQENDCKAVLFGHTHVAMHQVIDGIHVVNPGSLTRPRDGQIGSYALIVTEPGKFNCYLLHIGDDPRKIIGKKPKAKAGLLRKLLNFSDRL